jgi:hypothetical protein
VWRNEKVKADNKSNEHKDISSDKLANQGRGEDIRGFKAIKAQRAE